MTAIDLALPQQPGIRFAFGITRECMAGAETMIVERCADGSFFGDPGAFDFAAKDEAECRAKLAHWGYTVLVSENT